MRGLAAAICLAGLAAASAMVFGLAAQGAVAQEGRPTNDQLMGYFETVVFGNEVPGREAKIIRKWASPIRYKFGGLTAVAERSRAAARAHMASLTQFSNLAFEEIPAAEPGEQLVIWFTDTERMEADGLALAANPEDLVGTQGARCFFLSYYGADGVLVAARVVINADHGQEVVEHCLLEEVTQTLGLPNDDPAIIPSIFNDTMQLDALSFIDQVLVRMLYDPRLKPGTPRAEALKIARAVLEELNPGG
ncbi:MAG: DUF2927 domain-containing protein [Alphaproteobacteria bacterium]|nr:DUF2927 domain-containing protein [Alphaproteobacteria bacterium]MBT4711643.1 DUF2927 domain-containing protein [Alphaproteobacteria bacterium]MBT5860297.1 DUF2927 domain-containing protein [Alphaproteobacteria bacterium]